MNSNMYHLTRNRRSGVMQAVPESARSAGKGGQARSRRASMKLHPLACVLVAAVGVLGASQAAAQTVYTVTSSGSGNEQGTLIWALAAAQQNAEPGPHVIEFAPSITSIDVPTQPSNYTIGSNVEFRSDHDVEISLRGFVLSNGAEISLSGSGALHLGKGFDNPAGAGGAGISAFSGLGGFTLTNAATIRGGTGGAGGYNNTNGYKQGGNGGAGVFGQGFVLVNDGVIAGGDGGYGGGIHTSTPATSGAGGVGVQAFGNSTIINRGTISGGVNPGNGTRANAVEFSGTGNQLVIESGAEFGGNVRAINGGSYTLTLGGDADGTFDLSTLASGSAQFAGYSEFIKAGASTWTVTGGTYDGIVVEEGTLALAGGLGHARVLAGARLLRADGASAFAGDLGNEGTVDVRAGGGGLGTYDFSTTGTLVIEVAGMDDYGYVDANGEAELDGTLHVDVRSGAVLIDDGVLGEVIYASGGITGTFDTVTDNSLLFDFTPEYYDYWMDLRVLYNPTPGGEGGIVAALQQQGNRVGVPAGQALNAAFLADPGGDLAQAFLPLTTEREVSDAVTQSLPLVGASATRAARALQSEVKNIVQSRQSAARGKASGDIALTDRGAWVQPFGSWADQSERKGVPGYRADSYGIAVGADAAIADSAWRVGGAFSYASSDVRGKAAASGQKADIDLYQLTGYGTYALDDRTDLDVYAGIGRNSADTTRRIGFAGVTAKGSVDSTTAQLGARLGRSYALNESTAFTPSVSADYSYIKDDSYSEKGAGALNLKVKGRSSDALILGVDGKLQHGLSETSWLDASLGLGYDVINDRGSVTAAYAGAPGLSFKTDGAKASPWLVRGGVGAVIKSANNVEFSARYDAEYRDDYLNQTASVKVRWAF